MSKADVYFCSRGRKPRIFFTFCCLFSLIILGVIGLFYYYPDILGLSTSSTISYDTLSRSTQFQPNTGLKVESALSHNRLDALENSKTPSHEKSVSFVDDFMNSKNVNQQHFDEKLKFRHHAHSHFAKSSLGASWDDAEEKSFVSNVIENRFLHFDLKGAPPKVSYLKEIMKLAKKSGITGLLIEWEDTFPWSGKMDNLSLSRGGYSKEEVEDIINFAEVIMEFDVIPLVQTFGHAEFMLKGGKFKELREVPEDPQSFCPSNPGTIDLITSMIDQILEVHKNARHLHIGCDEVYNLRVCSKCVAQSEDREELFLHHVKRVGNYVRLKGRTPIIWDDMLRMVPLQQLNESGIGAIVEPMVWVYAEDVERFVGWDAWEKYAEIFPTIWGAAAFKGAFGETLDVPPLSRHADNVQRWTQVITRESTKWQSGVGGLVLTGWIRYDHFAVLCELLPAAVPSLVLNSLQMTIPNNLEDKIKNRVFVSKNVEESDDLPSSSPNSVLKTMLKTTDEEEMENPKDPNSGQSRIYKRSSFNYKRRISHPRILMLKDTSKHLSNRRRDASIGNVHDKAEEVTRSFCQILHCPAPHTNLYALLKGPDKFLNFASRCNFMGVAFFRLLFRLKSTLNEIEETIELLQAKKGWITEYNVRHNYSLPLRIDELVYADVPRQRRLLESIAKGAETSLKPIFHNDTIHEWIEQNVWETWKKLQYFEKKAQVLKNMYVWPKRPLKSPSQMLMDLKLEKNALEEL